MSSPKKVAFHLLGGGAVGKSSLATRFAWGDLQHEVDPTVDDLEFYPERTVTVDGNELLISITDTNTLEEYEFYKDKYLNGCDGFLLVYCINSAGSFDELNGFVEDLRSIRGDYPTPMVVCGNKADLEEDRVVSAEQGRVFAESLGCPFFETSAKTSLNVEEAFLALARCYISLPSSDNSNENSNEKASKCIIC